ncbi:MAG TPA: outer membrane lipoprotein-sorting protein [Spirochaetota bacterium]|nr:outer membrane lipoprotein-sorting protein [Spirochaetota bacterium]
MRSFLIALSALLALVASPLHALDGRQIMEKSDALTQPKSVRAAVLMLIEKGGRVVEKEFELVGKKSGDNERVLISFSRPTSIQLLTHTYKGRDDDQWLVLSSGKVKRIALADSDKPFVNSHFYYEDLKSRDIDDYGYTLLGDARAGGVDCYKVEAKARSKNVVYDKAVFYIDKTSFFAMRIDIYMKGELHKYLENHDIRKVNGILTPYRAVMHAADGKSKTDLRIKSVTYNVPIADSQLSKEALR